MYRRIKRSGRNVYTWIHNKVGADTIIGRGNDGEEEKQEEWEGVCWFFEGIMGPPTAHASTISRHGHFCIEQWNGFSMVAASEPVPLSPTLPPINHKPKCYGGPRYNTMEWHTCHFTIQHSGVKRQQIRVVREKTPPASEDPQAGIHSFLQRNYPCEFASLAASCCWKMWHMRMAKSTAICCWTQIMQSYSALGKYINEWLSSRPCLLNGFHPLIHCLPSGTKKHYWNGKWSPHMILDKLVFLYEYFSVWSLACPLRARTPPTQQPPTHPLSPSLPTILVNILECFTQT